MKIIFPIALVIAAGVLGYVAFFKAEAPGSAPIGLAMPAPGFEGVEEMVVGEERVRAYPMSEVATHNTVASCWAVIRGAVYDLTAWISNHPGGEQAILGLCGTDGTTRFEGKHGGAEKPEATLESFKIGVLAE